jgi:2,4-dienoyl-CoA reductase-like NADH-dependent reductase (Old Yellow Enzyme family)
VVRDAVSGRLAITAKLNMDDGVPGGFSLHESIRVAQWLEADSTVDALELTAGSSLLNPMYLFAGAAPIRDFGAQFRQPQRPERTIPCTGTRSAPSSPRSPGTGGRTRSPRSSATR